MQLSDDTTGDSEGLMSSTLLKSDTKTAAVGCRPSPHTISTLETSQGIPSNTQTRAFMFSKVGQNSMNT